MAKFVRGDVVIIPFPFSDLSQAKRRPALLIATLSGDDIILCQITSRWTKDKYSIGLTDADFVRGGLKQQSYVRPNRIFTADKSIALYKAGRIKRDKLNEVVNKVGQIIRGAER